MVCDSQTGTDTGPDISVGRDLTRASGGTGLNLGVVCHYFSHPITGDIHFYANLISTVSCEMKISMHQFQYTQQIYIH